MGECRGGCSGLGKEAGNEGWLQETGQESLFCAHFELPVANRLSMKIAPIYRAGKRVILSSMGKTSQPLIRLEQSKPLVQSVHLELSNLQTARGARFGPRNGAVPNLFDPTGPLPGIKGFQVDMLVHALSDLGAKRGSKHAWKSATRAARRGRQ
jgi:hypothetical protein